MVRITRWAAERRALGVALKFVGTLTFIETE